MLFNNKVVLIVEDSYTIRHQVRMLLNKYQLTTVEAYDKPSMLNNLHHNGQLVDIIIMDLGLKETSGFDLMAFLQETENYKNIPIIILTGDATKRTVVEAATSYNVSYYAIKPIDPTDLSTKVLTTLEDNHRPVLSIRPDLQVQERKEHHKTVSKSLKTNNKKETPKANSDTKTTNKNKPKSKKQGMHISIDNLKK